MPDPTPEERTKKIAYSFHKANLAGVILSEIRAAVAAETERIKKLCPWCHGKGSVGRLDEVEECETCSWIVAAVIRSTAPEPADAEG